MISFMNSKLSNKQLYFYLQKEFHTNWGYQQTLLFQWCKLEHFRVSQNQTNHSNMKNLWLTGFKNGIKSKIHLIFGQRGPLKIFILFFKFSTILLEFFWAVVSQEADYNWEILLAYLLSESNTENFKGNAESLNFFCMM